MASEFPESGLEELLRLSKQVAKAAQQQKRAEKERIDRRQKIQGTQQKLKDLKVSVALNQLESIATPEIIEAVSSLQNDQFGSLHLRKAILDLLSELEEWTVSASDSKQNIDSVCRSLKTLIILTELLFSLE